MERTRKCVVSQQGLQGDGDQALTDLSSKSGWVGGWVQLHPSPTPRRLED